MYKSNISKKILCDNPVQASCYSQPGKETSLKNGSAHIIKFDFSVCIFLYMF